MVDRRAGLCECQVSSRRLKAAQLRFPYIARGWLFLKEARAPLDFVRREQAREIQWRIQAGWAEAMDACPTRCLKVELSLIGPGPFGAARW